MANDAQAPKKPVMSLGESSALSPAVLSEAPTPDKPGMTNGSEASELPSAVHVGASFPSRPAVRHENPLARDLLAKLDYDQLTNCMRCGFCLPACPTFRETGLEPESPRGRIALMKAVADGIMEPDQAFRDQMYHCLGCRACEPACPADVKYGRLIEQTRDVLEDHAPHPAPVKAMRRAAFGGLFPSRSKLRWLGRSLGAYQKSGLRKLARGAGVLKLFPPHLREMEAVLPEASGKGVLERLGSFYPAKGQPVARVGMFRGCIMDVLFAETNVRTVKLLSEAGFEVVIPDAQTCCGALHAHSGELDGARELARGNIAAFKAAGVDYIASNAGGCGALLMEYDHLLHEDEEWREDAAWFAERVIDVSALIVDKGRIPAFAEAAGARAAASTGRAGHLGVTGAVGDAGAVENARYTRATGCARDAGDVKDARYAGAMENDASAHVSPASSSANGTETPAPLLITYQDSCHLRNVMKSSDAPRRLMRSVAGAEFVEMREADRCCGSAGIYNVTQPEMAGQILEHKMEHANRTQARYLLTSNPGCLLQMKLGIEKHGDSRQMEAMHIVDFLYERLAKDDAE